MLKGLLGGDHESLLERGAQEIIKDVELVPWEARYGRLQRSMAIMAAAAAIVSGFEAYVQHVRGTFHDRLMWAPIMSTPPMILAAVVALFSGRGAKMLLPVVSSISFVDGLVGFFLHLRGIGRLPGGYKLGTYNVVIGPPIFAPLLFCIVGFLGGLAAIFRREAVPPLPFRSSLVGRPRLAEIIGRQPEATNALFRLAGEIRRGRFQRGLALASGLFMLLSGGEAYFEHLRGSYNQRAMWTPVWLTPLVLAGTVGAFYSQRLARVALPAISALSFFDGVAGFFLHLRGIYRMPGHVRNLQFNVTMGPPLFAPLLFCAVGLLGGLATLLRRERT
jgi:hypothetical protein